MLTKRICSEEDSSDLVFEFVSSATIEIGRATSEKFNLKIGKTRRIYILVR
jgi:hypothetical protein